MNLFFMATSNGILSSLMICYQIMKKCSSATMTIYRLTIHFVQNALNMNDIHFNIILATSRYDVNVINESNINPKI